MIVNDKDDIENKVENQTVNFVLPWCDLICWCHSRPTPSISFRNFISDTYVEFSVRSTSDV